MEEIPSPRDGGGDLFVRPAWAVVRGWESPGDLVAGTEVNRKAPGREDGAEGSGVAKSRADEQESDMRRCGTGRADQ
jgi:hypothetical protein